MHSLENAAGLDHIKEIGISLHKRRKHLLERGKIIDAVQRYLRGVFVKHHGCGKRHAVLRPHNGDLAVRRCLVGCAVFKSYHAVQRCADADPGIGTAQKLPHTDDRIEIPKRQRVPCRRLKQCFHHTAISSSRKEKAVCLSCCGRQAAFSIDLLDGDLAGGGKLLRLLLRDKHGQHAGLVLGLHVLGLHVADVEAAGAGTGVALLTQHAALLVLFVLVEALLRADGQVTVLHVHMDLVLFKAGQLHRKAVSLGVVRLADIGLHQVLGVLAKQRAVRPPKKLPSKKSSNMFSP